MKRGFTLIELLVVIAIVALLSSVVISSVNASRSKAALAASRQFAANVYHAAGDEAMGIWEFDECSGTVANDLSGNGNTGTLTGGAAFSTDTPTGKGCSVSSSGTTPYVNAGSNVSLSSMAGSITVMGWVKYTTSGYNYIFSNDRDCCGAYNGYSLQVTGGGRASFRIWNGSAVSVTGSTAIQSGRWYHLAGTYDGSTLKVYVDGKLDGTTLSSTNSGVPASFNATLGALAACTNGCGRNLLIDSVYVFAKSLVAAEIESVYAQAISTRPFATR